MSDLKKQQNDQEAPVKKLRELAEDQSKPPSLLEAVDDLKETVDKNQGLGKFNVTASQLVDYEDHIHTFEDDRDNRNSA